MKFRNQDISKLFYRIISGLNDFFFKKVIYFFELLPFANLDILNM